MSATSAAAPAPAPPPQPKGAQLGSHPANPGTQLARPLPAETQPTSEDLLNRNTPALLSRLQVLATLACLAFAVLTGGGVLLGWQANRDAAANAAQLSRVYDIQSDLFRADSLATNAFLVGGLEPTAQRAAYDAAINRVSNQIAAASAAQAADRRALSVLNERVLAYAQGIQQARTYNRQGLPVGAQYLREASASLRSEVLPVADALVTANQDRAKAELRGQHPILLGLVGLATLAALLWVNQQLAQMFRRRINLGLLAAGGAVLIASIAAVSVTSAQSSGHLSLLDNEFAQAINVADARTAGNDARSQEALKLIARGAISEDLWLAAAERTSDSLQAASDPAVTGPWQTYTSGHSDIVEADVAGDWDKAVQRATQPGEGTVTAAFDAFDSAARDSATAAFETVTDQVKSDQALLFLVSLAAIAAGLAGAGFVAWGIGQRRKEFA